MSLFTHKNAITQEHIFKGKILNLRVDTLAGDNVTITREVVEHNGGVFIACQPSPSEVILIKQYRYPLDGDLIELPAGRVEIGEDRLVTAQRELIEETGYKAKKWHKIADMYSAPGFCNELLSFFHASDLEFVGISPDVDEEIEVLTMDLEAAWRLVLDGRIQDAKTIAGLGLLLKSKAST